MSLKCHNPAKCSATSFIQRILFVHRNTAQRGGKTPAEILLGKCTMSHCKWLCFQAMCFVPNPKHTPIKMTYLHKQGSNTSVVARPDNCIVLAQDARLSLIPSDSDEDSESPLHCKESPLSFRRSHLSRASPQYYCLGILSFIEEGRCCGVFFNQLRYESWDAFK